MQRMLVGSRAAGVVGALGIALYFVGVAAQTPQTTMPPSARPAWGAKEGEACIGCHGPMNPALVEEWRAGAHGQKGVNCFDCHRAQAGDVWQAQGTGPVTLTVDPSTRAEGTHSTRSLKVTSYLTCTEPITARYMQLRYPFCISQTWSSYDYLTVHVKVDKSNAPRQGGEFSVVLVDFGNKDQPEIWQATNWMEFKSDWIPIRIPLQGYGKGDPFKRENRFVIPEWEWQHAQNVKLDLDAIGEVWIKASSGLEKCASHPGFSVWVDEMRLE